MRNSNALPIFLLLYPDDILLDVVCLDGLRILVLDSLVALESGLLVSKFLVCKTGLEKILCSKHVVSPGCVCLDSLCSLVISLESYVSISDAGDGTGCKNLVLAIVLPEVRDCGLVVAELELTKSCIEEH